MKVGSFAAVCRCLWLVVREYLPRRGLKRWRRWRFGGVSTAVIAGPQSPDPGSFVQAYDDPRVRAAEEVAARLCPFCKRFYNHDIARSV